MLLQQCVFKYAFCSAWCGVRASRKGGLTRGWEASLITRLGGKLHPVCLYGVVLCMAAQAQQRVSTDYRNSRVTGLFSQPAARTVLTRSFNPPNRHVRSTHVLPHSQSRVSCATQRKPAAAQTSHTLITQPRSAMSCFAWVFDGAAWMGF